MEASEYSSVVPRAMVKAEKLDPVFDPLPGRLVRVAVASAL
jgi:hypothetical protein